MNIMVTGSPGVGKTILAKKIAKQKNYYYINEKDFALKNSIGFFNEENELEIPIKEFEKKANLLLKKKKNVVFEGHVICEMKLLVDKIILLRCDPEELETRLEKRNYSFQKIMDNVFCEGIDYCKKKLLKNYNKNKILEIPSKTSINDTFKQIKQKISE